MYICMHTRVIAHVWNLLQTLEHPCICMHEIYPIAEVAQPLLMGILVAPHVQIWWRIPHSYGHSTIQQQGTGNVIIIYWKVIMIYWQVTSSGVWPSKFSSKIQRIWGISVGIGILLLHMPTPEKSRKSESMQLRNTCQWLSMHIYAVMGAFFLFWGVAQNSSLLAQLFWHLRLLKLLWHKRTGDTGAALKWLRSGENGRRWTGLSIYFLLLKAHWV